MFTIEEYKEAVDFLSTHKKNIVIQNEGDEHAKIIFSGLFKTAEHYVKLAANTLRNPVVDSSDYQNSLDIFLHKENARLDIIVNHVPETISEQSNNNIYQRLRRNPAYNEGRIRIKSADGNHFFMGGDQANPINFCVADGRMYRIEDNIEQRTAIVNFNDPIKSEELEKVFDKAFAELTTDVDLKQYFAE